MSGHDRVEFGIIIEFKLQFGLCNRLHQRIYHAHLASVDICIIGCYIDFGVARVSAHHILRSVVLAEYLGVHEHTS
ncbi:hypothetical protein EVA_02334 [gut metagenome]|uniref:Uncharacterized protein n=1 Tax=gut metagenome TaxID=749906 RepID=J9GNB0_9ZZZZ